MAAIVPAEGLPLAVAILAGRPVRAWVGLLTGPVPVENARLAALAVEPTWDGYERLPVPGWFGAEDPARFAMESTPVTFLTGATVDITGYVVADAAEGGRAVCYATWGEPVRARRLMKIEVVAEIEAIGPVSA